MRKKGSPLVLWLHKMQQEHRKEVPLVFNIFNRCCRSPHKRWFAVGLVALGIILLLCFVPLQLWFALIGLIFIVAGICLLR